jgi:hypothetical protein
MITFIPRHYDASTNSFFYEAGPWTSSKDKEPLSPKHRKRLERQQKKRKQNNEVS